MSEGRYKRIRVGSKIMVVDRDSFREAAANQQRAVVDKLRTVALAAGVAMLVTGLSMETEPNKQSLATSAIQHEGHQHYIEMLADKNDWLLSTSQAPRVSSLPSREFVGDIEYPEVVMPHAPLSSEDHLLNSALAENDMDQLVYLVGGNVEPNALHAVMDHAIKEGSPDYMESLLYIIEDKVKFSNATLDDALTRNFLNEFIGTASTNQLLRAAYNLTVNEQTIFEDIHKAALVQALSAEASVEQLVQMTRMPWVVDSGHGNFVANAIINRGSPGMIMEVIEQDWLLTTDQLQTAQARVEHYGTPREMISFTQMMMSHPGRSMHLDPAAMHTAMVEKADIAAVIELTAIQQYILPKDLLKETEQRVAEMGLPADLIHWVESVQVSDHQIVAEKAKSLEMNGVAMGIVESIENAIAKNNASRFDAESESRLNALFDALTDPNDEIYARVKNDRFVM